MKRLLFALLLTPAIYVCSCGDDANPAPPQPKPMSRCGIFESGINEAMKGEFEIKVGAIVGQLNFVSQKNNRDMAKVSKLATGSLPSVAANLGINPAEYDGHNYKAADYWIEYMGNNKFLIHAKPINDPLHISKEVLIR